MFVGSVKSEELLGMMDVGEHCVVFSTLEWRNPLNTTSADRQPYSAV